MYKKIVASITILVLVLGSLLPMGVFADNELGYEGGICRDLGILQGDTGVVDSAYLKTRPSRLQAAIMFLRLKGKEKAALAYTGGGNFRDASAVAWKEGRNVLSYLKDHPELGWIGDGINFMPYKLVDSRAYYKVLLESLGYKQIVDDNGDFTWDGTLDFAAGKGLDKVAGIKDFTVASLAIATVEALETKMKASDRKLIEYLVDIGEVDKNDAIALGLYKKQLEASVKSVRAISNSKVEVNFVEAVSGSDATDEDLYDIDKLDIKAIKVKNENTVIIDTEAMNDNTTYTLEFDNNDYSFRGLKKDGYAPRLLGVECKDTDMVELAFDRVLDNASAQDTDTYSIAGVSIISAELDSTNTKVRLTTKGIDSGHSYELKITNIKNGDGVTAKLITKRFTGRKDTSAPKLTELTVLNNARLKLEFSDVNGLDKETAQDEDNYNITHSGGTLDVEAAEAQDSDDDGLFETVELVTESQEAGRSYTLVIGNITDASVLRNKISKEIKEKFRGKSRDRSAPSIARNPKALTDTMIEIEFKEDNALDKETVFDRDNYELEEDIEIEEIRIKDPDDLYSDGGRTVLLITSEMERSESYTLVINGIADEFGNEMSSNTKKYRFKGAADDRTPPYITSIECIDSKTIELNFDNTLDEESVENISHYRIDGLALVTKAVLLEDGKTAKLTVSSLSSDKNHTILLNGIRDLSGNTISNVSVNLLYNGNLNDDDPPEVSDIEAISEKEVWIRFDEEVYTSNARMKASGVSFEQVGNLLEDGVTVVMKAQKSMEDKEYSVTSLTGIWDLRNNVYELENNLDFYGTDIENDPPEVDYWEQMDVRRFRVVFNEPVRLIGNGTSGIDNPGGTSIQWTAELNPEEEDTNEGYSTIDYRASKDIPEDKEFEFNFTEMVSDYVGEGVFDEEDEDHGDSGSTILESSMDDDDEPFIEYAEGISRTKVQVVFSESMRTPGSYKITYEDDHDDLEQIDIDFVEVDSKDRTRVNIFTKDLMSDDYIYTLEPQSAAVDIAGNRLDIDDLEVEFAGSSIMSSDYIQGVEILNADTFKINKSSRIYKVNSLYELDADGDVLGGNLIENTSRVSDNVHKVISKKPLLRDVRYKITVDGIEYKFYGGIANGDLELELPEREITCDDMDEDEHYIAVYRANGDKLDVDKENDHFEIGHQESLENGELLYLYVIRESDGVIIYGTRVKVEGMPTASSSKKITSFSFVHLDPDVVAAIDEDDNIISLAVPYGTPLGHMTASFDCSEDAIVKVGTKVQISGVTENDFSKEVIYAVIAQDGTTRYYKVRVTVEDSKYEKRITSFILRGFEPEVTGIIDEERKLITLELPAGTDLKGIKPEIVSSEGTTVYPGSGDEVDFSEPVIYKVTAKDGSTSHYTVKVNLKQSSENFIKAFRFKDVDAAVTIITGGSENSISMTVPANTEIRKLIPIITISEHARITPEPGTAMDFSDEVVYTVTAQDGARRNYTVYVKKALSSDKLITSFSFQQLEPPIEVNVTEGQKTIELTVPYATDRSDLKASFSASPEAVVKINEQVQISGETKNDFTEPVIYTVEAQDGSSRNYIVIVTLEKSSEKLMREFGFAAPKTVGLIDQALRSISIEVPAGTDITKLAAVFSSSVDSMVKVNNIDQKSGETENDFTQPLVYTVVAQDGSSVEYNVKVNVAADSGKAINEFILSGMDTAAIGVIDQEKHQINIVVPQETDVSNMVASFAFTGKPVYVGEVQQRSGFTANDFRSEVLYKVMANDGSFLEYKVIVAVIDGKE